VADSIDSTNPDLNATQIYYNYAIQLPPAPTIATNISGDVTVITTINGNSGQATGPTITLSGGSTGYEFIASAGTVSLAVDNATTVRTSISAAKSGVNADITQFTGLTGNTGFNAWTGTPNQASHVTYSGTASVGYVQAELQGVMDSLQQATGLIMALLTALLANGVVES
jgi:hypothetical protein